VRRMQGTDLSGLVDAARQRMRQVGMSDGQIRLVESSVVPGANHAEASLFPNTLNSLNDGSITTLNDTTSAGPGNATWAFEWDITLNPGASFGLSKTLDVQVPEPSIAALLGVGTVLYAIRRRNAKRA